jgi:hypothetical protein
VCLGFHEASVEDTAVTVLTRLIIRQTYEAAHMYAFTGSRQETLTAKMVVGLLSGS